MRAAVAGVCAACLTPIFNAVGRRWEAAGTAGEDVVAEVLFAVDGDCWRGVIAIRSKGVAGITILGDNEAERRDNEEENLERTHG